jgi:catechol 2,3-dioxygenase-like lactoylglutathione lyase family enzyme
MKATVDFYSGVLGMPLTKTINLPNGMGQHFFFDIGNGDQLAFFWFPDAPESVPGVTHAKHLVGRGSITSAHASMNHVAFNVPADKVDEYQKKLESAGIDCTPVVNHDDSEAGRARRSLRRRSCARSTSRIPTAFCSSSPPGPGNSTRTTSTASR